MERLLQKSNINYSRLKSLISRVSTTELMKLTEPCYYPSLKKQYYEIINICSLKESDVKLFVKEYYRGTPASTWILHKDPITNLLIFLMNYFLEKKDIIDFKYTMILFIVRYYTNLIHKHIKYCDPDAFKYVLEHLTRTHLFVREKSIPGGLYHLSMEMEKRYKDKIKRGDVEDITKFITECRHRVAQSVRSFASHYYIAKKEGQGIVSQEEPKDDEGGFAYQTPKQGEKTVGDIVKTLTVYKVIDKKALDEARKVTGLNISFTILISDQLKDLKYADNIKNALFSFIKGLKNTSMLCKKPFYEYVKKMMLIRNKVGAINFRKEIDNIIEKMKKENNLLDSMSSSYSRSASVFLAFYITIILRNKMCPLTHK